MHTCRYCSKLFSKGYQLGGHVSRCVSNPVAQKTFRKVALSISGDKNSSKRKDVREKISKGRTLFLKKHPQEAPYLKYNYHKNSVSYPEKLLIDFLKKEKIQGWSHRYRNGIYEYDIAFPDLKIDIEVDGWTHLTDRVIKIDSKRDEFSKKKGWLVLRFTAKRVNANTLECVEKIKEILAYRSMAGHGAYTSRN